MGAQGMPNEKRLWLVDLGLATRWKVGTGGGSRAGPGKLGTGTVVCAAADRLFCQFCVAAAVTSPGC